MISERSKCAGTILAVALVGFGVFSVAANVVINEVAWAGTAASASDEWIELFNSGESPVDLTGWTLVFAETLIDLGDVGHGTVDVRRTVIEPGGYFVLERSDDDTMTDVVADLVYKGSLSNSGEDIVLLDAGGNIVDQILCAEAGWRGGSTGAGTPPYASMERVDPVAEEATWESNNGVIQNGLDADGEPVNGTPGAENSATIIAASAPRVELMSPLDVTEPITGSFIVTWVATDPDGSPGALRVSIAVSADDGESWEVLVENLSNAGSYAWDTGKHADGDQYRLRIIVADADGYSTEVLSEALSVQNPD
jgi:hypothetical protein